MPRFPKALLIGWCLAVALPFSLLNFRLLKFVAAHHIPIDVILKLTLLLLIVVTAIYLPYLGHKTRKKRNLD